jgi:hypothetical protein
VTSAGPYVRHVPRKVSKKGGLPVGESCLLKRRMADSKVTKTMQQQQVIENFINKGTGGRGTYVKADENVLFSQLPRDYRPWGRYRWNPNAGQATPFAVVQEAEARGANVRRQGEWFTIPTKFLSSELMRDVERGLAVYRSRHVLGRDGHHELEEAIIYRAGPRKGEVYARGVLRHIRNEHEDLDLGTIRWYLVVHNIQRASYTLSGGSTAQFD